MDINFVEFSASNSSGRVLGLDIGDKTVGVSVSDSAQFIASGVKVIKRTSIKKDVLEILNICINFNIIGLVYGWPIQINGIVGAQCEKVEFFVNALSKEIDLFFMKFDERFSTKITNDILIKADLSRKKRDKVIDKVAAIYILQGALDLINNIRRRNAT